MRSKRLLPALILAVVSIGLVFFWIFRPAGDQSRVLGGDGSRETGASGGRVTGPKEPRTRSERRAESGDDPAVNALIEDTKITDAEAGLRLLELAKRLESENKSGVGALEHAVHLLDDAGYQQLVKWFEASPPERRLAEVALFDVSSRKLSDQCRIRLALLKSPDPTLKEEANHELRFLLELEEEATEADIRFALGRVLGKEESENQDETK